MLSLLPVAFLIAVQSPVDCVSPSTNAQMIQCATEDFRKADIIMNGQWKATAEIMRAMDRDLDRTYDKRITYSAQLLASQRAWLQYRDAQCATECYGARGGSMETLLVSGCMEELTKARTKQLRDLVNLYDN